MARVGLSTPQLLLVTAAIAGWATAIAMIGPLLVDLSRDLDVPLAQAGLLGAAMSLPWALGAPLSGLLSDRLGRRPLMVLALCGVGGATIGSAFSTSFPILLVTRFAAGVFGAFGPASTMAAIGDLVPPQRRGSAMGWLNLGFGLAAVAGVPAVGVIAGLWGWRWAFAATGFALLVLAVLVHVGFPDPRPSGRAAGLRATYSAVLGTQLLGNVLSANLLERSIFNAAVLYLPSFLMLTYGLGPAEVAPALAVVAVGTIGGNIAGGWLGDRSFSRAGIFVVAQSLAGLIGLALFGRTPGLLISVAVGGLFSLVNATSRPAFLALGSELSPRHRGALLGLLSLTNQGGVVLGSALGGLAIAFGSYTALAALTGVCGVSAALLALPLARRRAPRSQPHSAPG
jgi:predicted MFS family arabinose efflux permease